MLGQISDLVAGELEAGDLVVLGGGVGARRGLGLRAGWVWWGVWWLRLGAIYWIAGKIVAPFQGADVFWI